MFSKFASSSLFLLQLAEKVDPTDIPEPNHSSRKEMNAGYLPYSEHPPNKRRPLKKAFVLPPDAVLVDLSQVTSSSTKKIIVKIHHPHHYCTMCQQ